MDGCKYNLWIRMKIEIVYFMDYIYKFHKNVHECLSVRVPVDPVQHRKQAITDLGQEQYFLLNAVQNGHIKRLTDQDIQSSVL